MLTLYSYPNLFGVGDNYAYGLKVFAFLRPAAVPFRHEHIFGSLWRMAIWYAIAKRSMRR